jgi:hypothetical protein
MTVKVRIDYSDGCYFMQRYTKAHRNAELGHSVISEHDWRMYQLHLENDRAWHDFMRPLANAEYEQDEERRRLSQLGEP